MDASLISDFFYQSDVHALLIATGLGAAIGLEREINRKDPSLRTFTLISIGSCIFAMLSISAAAGHPMADQTRIAAQIVAGIGFLGAGTIIRHRNRVRGLTTAALMWATAGVGTAVGFKQEFLAISATLIILTATLLLNFVHQIIRVLRSEPEPEVVQHASDGNDE